MTIDGRRNGAAGEWMSIHEAATLMGVSPATLRRWSDAGDIRSFTTPGGHRRFSRRAIAGLLPTDDTIGPTRDQIDGARGRLIRAVHRGSHRIASDLPWARAMDPGSRSAFADDGRAMIDGILATLEPDTRDHDDAIARARSAAMRSGELAARGGIGLRATVETCLRLRTMVIRELATAARRHDMDGPATSRWLETATREMDVLINAVMSGHEGASMAAAARAEALRSAGIVA